MMRLLTFLHKWQQRLRSDERGVAVAMVAITLTVLLGIAALGVDAGLLYLERVELLNATDAAALAGVQELPDRPSTARQRAVDYAVRNGVSADLVQVEVKPGNTIIVVTAQRSVPLYFARVLGWDRASVAARSAAKVGNAKGLRRAAPFLIERQPFVFNKQYTLKTGAGPSGDPYSGNYGAGALGGSGASRYEDNIKYGYDGWLQVGDWINTEPGNMAGPTARGVKYRIDQDPGCTPEANTPDCTRVVFVPIADSLDVNGRKPVQIVGFAAFYLEGTMVDGNGTGQTSVIGRFLRMATDADLGEGGDYGLRTYALTAD